MTGALTDLHFVPYMHILHPVDYYHAHIWAQPECATLPHAAC